MKKKLVIFTDGTSRGGSTGAANLLECLDKNKIQVVAIVSRYQNGGAKNVATRFHVPFFYFCGPYTKDAYCGVVEEIKKASNLLEDEVLWFALSGWFHFVCGLDFVRTFNIHPASLPQFAGMWGEKLHRAVWAAYCNGEIFEGEIVMHFLTEKIDDDQAVFFRHRFPLFQIQTYEAYRESVRNIEHSFQPKLTQMVLDEKISWDGENPETIIILE
jgi:folate-dependent phosphoribosylglycinamide formyltransferase PurN